MEPRLVVALAVVVVALAVIAVLANRARWKKRRERWTAVAVELGFSVVDGSELLSRCGSLPIFQKGRDRRVRNLVRGSTWGPEAWLADYQYVTGAGKNQRTHLATICVLRDSRLSLPQFELAPENPIADRFATLLGMQDVDFDDDPAFSTAYRLIGPDEAAIRAAFDQSVRSQLAQRPVRVEHLEGAGDAILVHHDRLVDPGAAQELLQLARELHSIFRS